MPEYACEPETYQRTSTQLDVAVYTPPPGKYENNEVQFVLTQTLQRYAWTNGAYYYEDFVKVCGFLAETPPPSTSASDDRPISFYLAIVAIVYCVVLTVVFTVWACRHPRIPAVSRRVSPQVRYAPQVVAQQPKVVIEPTAMQKV